MVRSNCFLKKVQFLALVSLHTCGQMGSSPCYLQSQVVCVPTSRPVALFNFLAKVPFLAGCSHIDIKCSPGDTDSKYISLCV